MEPESPYERFRHIKLISTTISFNTIEQNFRDYRYHCFGLKDFVTLEGTVEKCTTYPADKNDDMTVRVITLQECTPRFWYFKDADPEKFILSSQLKPGDKITITIWDLNNPSIKSQFIKSITLPRPIPIGVKFTITYDDATSISINSKDSVATLEAMRFVIQYTHNEKLKKHLTKGLNSLCVSCGREGIKSCSSCDSMFCDKCIHNCEQKIDPSVNLFNYFINSISEQKIIRIVTECEKHGSHKYTIIPLEFLEENTKLNTFDLDNRRLKVIKLSRVVSVQGNTTRKKL